jgi:hypothetical protein
LTIATKNRDDLKKQLQAMRIPGPQNWFVDAFSNDAGAKQASLYSETCSKSESAFIEYFSTIARPGRKLVAAAASGGDAKQATPFCGRSMTPYDGR